MEEINRFWREILIFPTTQMTGPPKYPIFQIGINIRSFS